jgi:alternate signal-mediated exported protein
MNRKKTGKKQSRKGMIAASVLAVALLLAGGVYAYLTYGTRAINEFSAGSNEIEIEETFTPPKQLKPGANSYTKKVAVKNTGNIPCYVRVYADFSEGDLKKVSGIQSGDGAYYSAELEGIQDDIQDENGKVVINHDSFINHLPEGWVYIPETDADTDTVEDAMGGWFYYTEPLEAGEVTPNLFDSVLTYFASESDITSYQIIVYAESVQIRDREGNLVTTGADTTGTGTTDTTGTTGTTDSTGTTDTTPWKTIWKQFLEGR